MKTSEALRVGGVKDRNFVKIMRYPSEWRLSLDARGNMLNMPPSFELACACALLKLVPPAHELEEASDALLLPLELSLTWPPSLWREDVDNRRSLCF